MDPVLSSILGPVCERLLNAALKEYRLVRCVKEEVRKLASMVDAVRDVLQDAERKQAENTRARTWLKDLKQLLLDAEDVLDEIATDEALRAKRDAPQGTRSVISCRQVAKPFKTLSCLRGVGLATSNRAIAHQIKDINKRFVHITRLKNELGLHHVPGEICISTVFRPRRPETTSVLRSDAQLIGRDDDMSKMKNLLLESPGGAEKTLGERNVQVICVVGMGGIGKTTLVKHVYNDSEVRANFQLTKWVCVSNDFDVKRISGHILVGREGNRSSSWDAVLVGLRNKIQGKRFLLVLDDVWEEDPSKWDTLYDPLSHGAKGSKIVMTTRNKKVSNITKGMPIFLKDLSNGDLWTILHKYAFEGHDPKENMQLVYVGRKIVEKLKGSPLTAKTIGRLLNSNMDVRHWTCILKSEALLTPSQGDAESILPVLKLSYDHLPAHLKQSLAYCSLFPEDHGFHRDYLVRLWVAQRFIDESAGSHAESVGSESFDYLVHLSLIEKHASFHYLHGMHDLIHDLVNLVSKDDILTLKDDQQKIVNPETIRHVSVIEENLDPTKLLVDLSEKFTKLRTLLFLYRSCLQLDRDHLDFLFTKLKRLRVLGLCDCEIKELPESIEKLKHLRYLDLSHNGLIRKLPDSLCNLHNLQVLDLEFCHGIDALPENMSALINLRHLMTYNFDLASSIRGLGMLTALHELRLNCRTIQSMKVLEGMTLLRKLHVESLEEVKTKEEAMVWRLHEKEQLEILELRWSEDRDDQHRIDPELETEVLECLGPTSIIRKLIIENYGGIRSPRWMEDPSWVSPCSLEIIVIKNCRNWVVPPPLALLPCLKILKVTAMKHVRRIGSGQEMAFPWLEELEFEDMDEWEEWEVPPLLKSSLVIPRLQKLKLRYCPKLRHLPPLPPSLRELEIENVGLIDLPWWQFSSSSPPLSLSILQIRDCPNLTSLAVGLLVHPLPVLVELIIRGCEDLLFLPEAAFGHLTSLKKLEVSACPKLEWPTLLPLDDALPRSLQSIHIGTECDRISNLMMQAIIVGSAKLTHLRVLHIEGCRSLPQRIMPLEGGYGRLLPPSLQEIIVKYNGNLEMASLSDLLRGLSSLRSLTISGSSSTASPPTAEMQLQPTAIQALDFGSMKGVKSLGGLLLSLTSLEYLKIDDCPELADFTASDNSPSSLKIRQSPADGDVVSTSIKHLTIKRSTRQQIKTWLLRCPFLQELNIKHCPHLIGFGGNDGADMVGELEAALLNLSTTLHSLEFWGCDNLCSLPSMLGSLSSLESMRISFCPKIRRLPAGGLPPSLRTLTIRGCPALEERCKEGVGSDWSLVAHVSQRWYQ